MTYLVLKFLHIGSMFLATALAVGPIVLFALVLRTADVASIRRVFRFAEPLSRAGGGFYGLGIVFGIVAALTGAINLASPWLVTAYLLIGLLVVSNLYADRWMTQVARAAEQSTGGTASTELDHWRQSTRPLWSLAGAVAITLAIVFVMVVKPTLF
jgi:uncharacterized membrane protein